MNRHPMQPLVIARGVIRFKENKIVSALLAHARKGEEYTLEDIARDDFSQDDREQFAQLMGYSIAGFNELSYVSDATCNEVEMAATLAGLGSGRCGCRATGCQIHCGVEREKP